jgi:hypothetical protein
MTTHFITCEVTPESTPQAIKEKVEKTLAQHGQPLRWAITEANGQTLKVEAVITKT